MTGSRNEPVTERESVVSGFVLRLARESAAPPCTREALAQLLDVSVDTVAGWETGRRALSAIRVSQAAALRHTLMRVGAAPSLVQLLATATEADLVIDHAMKTGETYRRGDSHPLGAWVLTRDVVELIAWPMTTRTPTNVPPVQTVRRGPSTDRPSISTDAKQRFFNHLRRLVSTAHIDQDALLRRQALYLLSFDHQTDAPSWLAHHRGRLPHGFDGWSSAWPTARSLAASMTRHGDRTLLLDFIDRGLNDERSQTANLNYWAYWVGEQHTTERDDSFMPADLGSWRGDRLLHHLVDRLDGELGYVDLNVHTTWALLAARPRLLDGDPRTTADLRRRVDVLLDTKPVAGPALGKLEAIRYALRLQH
jgi:hypothetical protein